MSTQPNRERQIFDAALELTSPEARSGYLLGACGADAELHARVESLLRALEQVGGFLSADDPNPPATAPTKTILMTAACSR